MRYLIFFISLSCMLFMIACQESTSSADDSVPKEAYLQKGKTIAAATFATLSGNLQKAMQAGGVENAVKYCNLAATPLVDSLSKVHQAAIRRTSLKTRNPKNKPTAQELKQLQAYQESVDKGEKIKPLVQEIDPNTIAFYAPINTMPLCQKCHGIPGETLLERDYEVIQGLYPEDRAIGYRNGELRGMWSISFEKSK